MPKTLQALEKTLEHWTGMKVSDLRDATFEDNRKSLERKGDKLQLYSEFPLVGRGNVNRKNIVPHDEVETELDKALS